MVRIILLLALALRIAAAFIWQGMIESDQQRFRFGDSETYWVLAEKIADGRPYEYASPNSRIFRTPLYPIFLAPATWLHGRTAILAARIAGAACGTLAVAMVIYAASSIANRQAGLWAGVLAAIYPGAIGMSIFILSEAIFCPLCLLCLITWFLASKEKSSIRWTVASGIACGLACLARPSWFLWPGLLALGAIAANWRMSGKRHSMDLGRYRTVWIRLAVFGVAMSLSMAPWWIRNYRITGRFVPTTLQVGPSLYDGLHEGASGASDEGMAFSIPFEHELHAEDAKLAQLRASNSNPAVAFQDSFEWRLNQRMLNAAIRWANENRSDTLRLAMVKFVKMWSPWPTAKELGGVWIRIAESIVYVVIVSWAGCALFCVVRHRQSMILYASPTMYFAALHLIFTGSVRYRQPAILVLCVVAGIGAAWMLDRIKERNHRTPIGSQ